MKKTRFGALGIVFALAVAVAFFAGRATVKVPGQPPPAKNAATPKDADDAMQAEPHRHPAEHQHGQPQPPPAKQTPAPMTDDAMQAEPHRHPAEHQHGQPQPPPAKQAPAPMTDDAMQAEPHRHPAEHLHGQPQPPPPGPEGKRKILYWRAPMDPNYISDKPGKSPMGMDLVPVYEDEVSSKEVRISPATVQQIGVTTAEVTKGPFFRSITTYGTSTWSETSLAVVSTKIDGWIENLSANETGQRVRKGQPLVEIYSPALVSAQQEYLSALDDARRVGKSGYGLIGDASRKLAEAARMRLKLWDISDGQIDALKKSGKIRRTLTLYAPISGIVTERQVTQGEYVKAGASLIKVAGLQPIWVMGSVYEEEIPLVGGGMKAAVSFDTLPGQTFEGTVDYVYPYVEGRARTAQVRIVLPNRDQRILPRMYATVKLRAHIAAEALQVPDNAVIRASSTDNVVFVALGEGRFAGRKVVLGPEGDGGMVMVKAGLEAGERVVTSAQFLLDSESRLKAAIQAMTPHGSHSP